MKSNSSKRNFWLILLTQTYSIIMFVLFFILVYLPYNSVEVDLFPLFVYKVSWKAFGYYTLIFIYIWVYVFIRLKALSCIKEKITFKQLVVWDLLIALIGIPFIFIYRCRLLLFVVLGFSLLLLMIDLLWNSKKRLKFLHSALVLFVFVNIVLLFVNWRSNINKIESSSKIVDYYRQNERIFTEDDLWSIAIYKNNRLLDYKGNFPYPEFHLFNLPQEGFNKVEYKELDSHYLYRYGDYVYVVSYPSWHPIFRYLVNFTYVFTIYLLITFILFVILSKFGFLYSLNKSFFSKLLYTIVLFMMGCMLFVLILVSLYIRSKYEKMSKNTQEYRTELFVNYINPVLEMYDDAQILQIRLNRIADVLKTKIVIYDRNGDLYLKSDKASVQFENIYNDPNNPFLSMTSAVEAEINKNEQNVVMNSYTIVFDRKKSPLYVILSTDINRQSFDHEIAMFLILVLNMYFIGLIISIIISYFITKRFSAPIIALDNNMKSVNLTGENEKLEYTFTEDDALAQLVNQYNNLIDKLKESAEQLAQKEREESWRQMASQIAHEIKNPLTPMRLLAQNMITMKCDDIEEYEIQVRKSSEILLKCIDNIKNTTDLLSNFAHASNGIIEKVDIVEKLMCVVDLFSNNEKNADINFYTKENNVIIMADKNLIFQVFNNIVNNAVQSIPDDRKGKVNVELHIKDNIVYVEVSDNGVGISKQNLENIFKVSFTTKAKGMGLGLCVAKKVIELSQGTIRVESEENIGSKFIITFPIYREEN